MAFQTGGVVRRLCAAAYAQAETQPLFALTLAETAVVIAESRPDTDYPQRGIFELRGHAYFNVAFAQRTLARYEEALASLKDAEDAYKRVSTRHYELARIDLARAWVLARSERHDEAAGCAKASAAVFLRRGDVKHYRDARFLEGYIFYQSCDYRAALRTWTELRDTVRERDDAELFARLTFAVGNCLLHLDQLTEARSNLERSLAFFTERQMQTEVLRARWRLGRLQLVEGDALGAELVLRECYAGLKSHGLAVTSCLVGLDLADSLIVQGRASEIAGLCQEMQDVFRRAKMLNAQLTAISYLRDRTARGVVSPRHRSCTHFHRAS